MLTTYLFGPLPNRKNFRLFAESVTENLYDNPPPFGHPDGTRPPQLAMAALEARIHVILVAHQNSTVQMVVMWPLCFSVSGEGEMKVLLVV